MVFRSFLRVFQWFSSVFLVVFWWFSRVFLPDMLVGGFLSLSPKIRSWSTRKLSLPKRVGFKEVVGIFGWH